VQYGKFCTRNLKPIHITMKYVTVKLTAVTMNMCEVNIVIKKNVTMCLHMKLIVMEIT